MNTGARVGLALAAGYVLGRLHKVKWALALAALAGRGRLPGGPGGLVQQGVKLLASSPEFTKLTDEMKGRLVDAGKAAAAAAVSSKIDSLSESLRERTDAMRAASAGGEGGAQAGEEEDVESERDRDEDERYRGKGRAADSRREPYPEEDEGGRVPAPRRPAPRGESDRPRGGRESRGREEPAARGRARHPARHGGDGEDARSGAGARQGEDGGGDRPRSPASRTGDDIE
jgi:hypothetical protein